MIVGGLALSMRVTKDTIEGDRPTKTIGLTDLSGSLYDEIDSVFAAYNKNNENRRIELERYAAAETDVDALVEQRKQDIRNKELDGYLLLGPDVVTTTSPSYYYLAAKSIIDLETFSTIRNLVNEAVRNERIRRNKLSPQLYAAIRRHVPIEQIDLSTKAGGRPREFEVIMVPFFFMILMFIGVWGTNQQMLTSVIEEKNARVMEVILSAVTPFQLMAGKIAGLAAAGFTLVVVWAGAGFGAAAYRGLTDVLSIQNAACFIVYFILGFLLFSAILAAVGAACNTVKEAQQMVMPLSFIFFLPMLLWLPVAQKPDGILAVILSFIPPITPMIMMARIAANPDLSLVQIALSILLMLVSVPAAIWAAARIFRVGVLMYGKPPTPRELLRWLRSS
jgi:ABC-2 type transport system permease protein